MLTPFGLTFSHAPRHLLAGTWEERAVDAVFIVAVIALCVVTYWFVRALARLGGIE